MKRSRHICLTLLASLSLAACDSEEPTQRAMYLSRQACVEDWGSDDECEDDDNDGHWHGPHYYYHSGRPYYYAKNSKTPMAVPASAQFSRVSAGSASPRAAAVTSSSISRGGFGGRSSFHSAAS